MRPYNNAAKSGVRAFEAGNNFIILEFGDSKQYLYNGEKPGTHHVEKMIALAAKGSGLNTYINKHVRNNYAERLK